MDYFTTLCYSFKYIANHLFDVDLVKKVHKEAAISRYHFHRIFLLGTKFTLGDYIKRRRFTEIEKRVVLNSEKIIDIAVDCSYNSHEALTRAFKSFYGVSPSLYRTSPIKNPLLLQEAFIPEDLNYTYYNLNDSPQLVNIEDMKIMGISGETSLKNNTLNDLWSSFIELIQENKLDNSYSSGFTLWLSQDSNLELIGEDTKYKVALGIDYIEEDLGSLKLFEVPDGLYACFNVQNSFDYIYQTYSYIYFTWLKKNKYDLSDGVVFEEYNNSFSKEENRGTMKIYIPIKKQ